MPLIKKNLYLLIIIQHIHLATTSKIINNPLIIRWYGQNMKYHNKTQGIPLDYKTHNILVVILIYASKIGTMIKNTYIL